MQKRNKLNDNKNEGSRKKTDNTSVVGGSIKANNINKNNNNQLKNDTYESVCSPEDVAERNRLASRNAAAHSQNGSMTNVPTTPMNNARILKRVVSAPVPGTTEPKGNITMIF